MDKGERESTRIRDIFGTVLYRVWRIYLLFPICFYVFGLY